MNRVDFERQIARLVAEYNEERDVYGADPRLRINPVSLLASILDNDDFYKEIEDADEAVENSAAADGAAEEEYDDFQAGQNPDFYPLKNFVKDDGEGNPVPDSDKIARLADKYFN